MTTTDVRAQLLEVLRAAVTVRDGQTTYQLLQRVQRELDVGYHDVQAVLFRNATEFQRDSSSPARWYRNRAASSSPARSGRLIQDRIPAPYTWQAEALQRWRDAGHVGVIEAVTGAGKTVVGTSAVRDALRDRGAAVVLVPSTPLVHQWHERLRDQLPGCRISLVGGGHDDAPRHADVVITTVQSAAIRRDEIQPPGCTLLVADECHRYGAEFFQRSLLRSYERRLGLTATLARLDDGVDRHLRPFFGDTIFSLGYARALEEEVVAPWRVTLHGVHLDAEHRLLYDENRERSSKALHQLITDYGYELLPFGEFLKRVTATATQQDQRVETQLCRTYLAAFKEYRRALAETPVKLQALAALTTHIEAANGTLVFTDSIASAEAAARLLHRGGISARALHSETPEEERQRHLSGLRAGRVRAIVSPRVLDEGIDVPNADLGIILAASRTRRQMVQRMGRVLRRKPDGGLAHFVIVYAIATVEDPSTGAHEAFLDEILPLSR